jgi:hypothetical protein
MILQIVDDHHHREEQPHHRVLQLLCLSGCNSYDMIFFDHGNIEFLYVPVSCNVNDFVDRKRKIALQLMHWIS